MAVRKRRPRVRSGMARRLPTTRFEDFCEDQRVRIANRLSTSMGYLRDQLYGYEFSDYVPDAPDDPRGPSSPYRKGRLAPAHYDVETRGLCSAPAMGRQRRSHK